jgi:hypothetical protein
MDEKSVQDLSSPCEIMLSTKLSKTCWWNSAVLYVMSLGRAKRPRMPLAEQRIKVGSFLMSNCYLGISGGLNQVPACVPSDGSSKKNQNLPPVITHLKQMILASSNSTRRKFEWQTFSFFKFWSRLCEIQWRSKFAQTQAVTKNAQADAPCDSELPREDLARYEQSFCKHRANCLSQMIGPGRTSLRIIKQIHSVLEKMLVPLLGRDNSLADIFVHLPQVWPR